MCDKSSHKIIRFTAVATSWEETKSWTATTSDKKVVSLGQAQWRPRRDFGGIGASNAHTWPLKPASKYSPLACASLDSPGSPSSPTTMSAGETQSSLRQRRKSSAESIKTDTTVNDFHKTRKDEEVVWGKTPAGEGACF